jgi:hypothetical protein
MAPAWRVVLTTGRFAAQQAAKPRDGLHFLHFTAVFPDRSERRDAMFGRWPARPGAATAPLP